MNQVQVSLGGVVMYGDSPKPPAQRGCYIVFNKLLGWWDGVGSTGETIQRDFADGAWITPAFDEARTIVVEGHIWADDQPTLRDGIAWMKTQIPKSELGTFVAAEHEVTSHALVRRDGQPRFPWSGRTNASFSIQLIAPDPRKFGGPGASPFQHQQTAFLPSTTGGLQVPLTVPFSIGATVVNGSVTVTASGDAPPPVLVRINGPAVQPIIWDELGGAMPLDISLDAGQWLDVDLDARTIKINSTVNRRNLLRGPWITPRSGMVLSLDAAVYDPLTSMTVFWTDASY